MASNKRRRHTPDQIIRKLAEGNKLLGAGQELSEVCRHLQIAESTWHRWIAQYGGMKANEAKRLKELERQAQLRRLAETGEPVHELAKAFGISRATAYRYLSAPVNNLALEWPTTTH